MTQHSFFFWENPNGCDIYVNALPLQHPYCDDKVQHQLRNGVCLLQQLTRTYHNTTLILSISSINMMSVTFSLIYVKALFWLLKDAHLCQHSASTSASNNMLTVVHSTATGVRGFSEKFPTVPLKQHKSIFFIQYQQ